METIGIKDWKAFLSFLISSAALTSIAFRYDDFIKVTKVLKGIHPLTLLFFLYIFLLIDFTIVYWKLKSKLITQNQIIYGTFLTSVTLIIVVVASMLCSLFIFHKYNLSFTPFANEVNPLMASIVILSLISFSVYQGIFNIISPDSAKIDYTGYHLMRNYFLRMIKNNDPIKFSLEENSHYAELVKTSHSYLIQAKNCLLQNEPIERSVKAKENINYIETNIIKILFEFFDRLKTEIECAENGSTINWGELKDFLLLQPSSAKLSSLINAFNNLTKM